MSLICKDSQLKHKKYYKLQVTPIQSKGQLELLITICSIKICSLNTVYLNNFSGSYHANNYKKQNKIQADPSQYQLKFHTSC